MKAFCVKHYQGYEVGIGCPDCNAERGISSKPKETPYNDRPLYSLPPNLRDKVNPKWNEEKKRWEIDSTSLYTSIYWFGEEDWDFTSYGWEADYSNQVIFSPRSL